MSIDTNESEAATSEATPAPTEFNSATDRRRQICIVSKQVPEAVAQEFHLTPAEIRVLFSIVDVGGVPEVAEILGISDNTVRTHLQHVFEKTETNRQTELVKLVAGYASPFAA